MAADRVALPRLLSRSWSAWAAVAAGFVGGLAVMGWYAATDPTNRPLALALMAVGLLCAVLVLARRRWLEPDTGDIVVQVLWLWRRRWRLAEASAVKVIANQAGQVLLRVEDGARRTPFQHALLARDLGGERTRSADHLSALAEQVERWAPRQQATAGALRAQADHLARGGTVADSPLARRFLPGLPQTSR